jgi:hypothetical protein
MRRASERFEPRDALSGHGLRLGLAGPREIPSDLNAGSDPRDRNRCRTQPAMSSGFIGSAVMGDHRGKSATVADFSILGRIAAWRVRPTS